jgi:small-conductance mechanosensitive channel
MNAAHSIRRLEEAGFTHQQGCRRGHSEVIENVATRDYVGAQIALVRKELAEQIGAVRQELAEQIGAVRQELAEQIGAVRQELAEQIGAVRQELAREAGSLRTEIADTRTEVMRAINRLTFWMNGFLAAQLVAVLGVLGVLIGRL